MPQRCMCPNFNWEYLMIAELQRRKLNMFKWREGMLSPRALFRGNPARVKFAAENSYYSKVYIVTYITSPGWPSIRLCLYLSISIIFIMGIPIPYWNGVQTTHIFSLESLPPFWGLVSVGLLWTAVVFSEKKTEHHVTVTPHHHQHFEADMDGLVQERCNW